MTVQEKQKMSSFYLLFTFIRLPWSWSEPSGLQHDTLSWHSFGLRDEARSLFIFVSWLLCMWLPKNSCSQGPLGGKVFRVGAEVKAVGIGDAASKYCRCFKTDLD